MNRGLQILLSKYGHLNFDVYQRNGCKERFLDSMMPNEALKYGDKDFFTNQEVSTTWRF